MGIATPECYKDLENSIALRGTERYAVSTVLVAGALPLSSYKELFPHGDIHNNACSEVLFYRIGSTIQAPVDFTTDLSHEVSYYFHELFVMTMLLGRNSTN